MSDTTRKVIVHAFNDELEKIAGATKRMVALATPGRIGARARAKHKLLGSLGNPGQARKANAAGLPFKRPPKKYIGPYISPPKRPRSKLLQSLRAVQKSPKRIIKG